MDLLNYQLSDINGKTALITGASSGIGQACAMVLASHGVNLNLVARREDRLISILEECNKNFPNVKVKYVVTDINADDAITKLTDADFFNSDICINNAGLALGKDTVETGTPADWSTMLKTNTESVFKITHCALPYLKKNGGDIICISSIAAHEYYPGGAIYCATKAAVRAFMSSLRKETFGEDIRVMMLSPGMVNTEFSTVRFQGDTGAADKTYEGMTPLTAMDMAQHILYMISRPRHVNMDDMICLPTDQGSTTQVKRS